MKLDELLNILENMEPLKQIKSTDVPNINLYMDQVLTFMNDNLEFYKRNENDKLFTKSMINNYVKNDMIPKPENKKYFPQHIVALIHIFYMKQILSLDDIKSIFKSYTDEHFDGNSMLKLYNTFLCAEKNDAVVLKKDISELAEKVYSNEDMSEYDDTEKLFMFISLLVSRATAYKVIIEKILDSEEI